MEYLAAGGLLFLVVVATSMSSPQGRSVNGCCAPADPRDDLRMRAAYTNDGMPPTWRVRRDRSVHDTDRSDPS